MVEIIKKIFYIAPKYLLLLFVLLFSYNCFAHKNADIHYIDFIGVFNGYGDSQFEYLTKEEISKGIDSYLTPGAFPYEYSRAGLKTPGNHRILAHAWSLEDKIPQHILDILNKENPGREKDIVNLWENFQKKIFNNTLKITGLPKSHREQAKAFASLIYNIHLLGDWEPDNAELKYVLHPYQIQKNLKKNFEILFAPKPKYYNLINRKMNQVLYGMRQKNLQKTAQALMDELYHLHIGTMLNDTWGDKLKIKYSIDRVINAKEILAKRSLQRAGWINSSQIIHSRQLKRVDFKNIGDKRYKLKPGLLTRDGQIIIPMREGIKTGVIIFAMDAGIPTYKYFHGDILKPQFEDEIIDAAIKGGCVGAGIGISVLMGITPGGITISAIGTGLYIVTDFAISKWHEYQSRNHLTIKDLRAYGIQLDTILELEPSFIFSPNYDSTLDLEIDSTLDL